MASKFIVVLANSLKHQQHCVAGKCVTTKEWIRPVADASGKELSHEQAKCANPYGTFNAKPKQKVIIGLQAHAPLINQPENHIVDNSIWQQHFGIEDGELNNYLDRPVSLWGASDRVLYPQILNGSILISQSLYLVKVNHLKLYKNHYDKRRASFSYNGLSYDLAVTDPKFDEIVRNNRHPNGTLCISLAEKFEGACYKLVATIF